MGCADLISSVPKEFFSCFDRKSNLIPMAEANLRNFQTHSSKRFTPPPPPPPPPLSVETSYQQRNVRDELEIWSRQALESVFWRNGTKRHESTVLGESVACALKCLSFLPFSPSNYPYSHDGLPATISLILLLPSLPPSSPNLRYTEK